jgi:hypothetical protein
MTNAASGYPGFNTSAWLAVSTPTDVAARLHS